MSKNLKVPGNSDSDMFNPNLFVQTIRRWEKQGVLVKGRQATQKHVFCSLCRDKESSWYVHLAEGVFVQVENHLRTPKHQVLAAAWLEQTNVR